MRKDILHYFLLLIIIVCAFIFRVFPAIDFVFSDSRDVFLLGVDPYFYLRQVETTLKNFPLLQKFDHAAQFPNGIISDATGLYTLFLAQICKILLDASATTAQISAVLAWVAPTIACVIYWLVYKLSSNIKNKTAGLLSVLILLLYPGLFLPRSFLGFPDHHVVEILLAIWLLMTFTSDLYKIQSDSSSIKNPLSWAVLPFVLFFTVWSGAPLYIILISLASYNYLVFFEGSSDQIKKLALFLLSFFGLSGVLLFIIQQFVPSLITLAFSQYSQIISPLLISIGVIIYLLVYLKKFLANYFSAFGIQLILLIAEFLVGISIINYTAIGKDIYRQLVFKTGLLQENMPVDFFSLLDMISIPGLLALVFSLKYLLQFVRQKTTYLHYLPTIIFTGFFVFMWLSTYDMGYMLMPLISTITGVFLYDLIYSTLSVYSKKTFIKVPFSTLSFLLLLFTITKPLFFSSPNYPFIYSSNQIKPFVLYTPSWHEAMDWLSNNSPTLEIPTDSIVSSNEYHPTDKQYGVLTSWDYGNIVNQRAKRIPTWSRWPNNSAEAELYKQEKNFNPKSPCSSCSPEHPIKYIVVNDKMASDFFNIKFKDIHGGLDSCLTTTTLLNEGLSFEASTLGDCYSHSLIYKLYRGVDVDTAHFTLLWESPQQKFTGYLLNESQLSMVSIDPNDIDDVTRKNLISNKMASFNNTIFYDSHFGPEVKIYAVKNKIGSEKTLVE